MITLHIGWDRLAFSRSKESVTQTTEPELVKALD